MTKKGMTDKLLTIPQSRVSGSCDDNGARARQSSQGYNWTIFRRFQLLNYISSERIPYLKYMQNDISVCLQKGI